MTAIKLIPVLNMYCPVNRSYRGKAKTDDGLIANGYFVRQFKATEHLLVYYNGNLTRRYLYPRVVRKFSNPMVNMYNLNFVGGWHFKDENKNLIGVNKVHLVHRVIAGLKPMAWLGAFKCHIDHVRNFHEAIKLAKESGLAVREFERATDLLGAVVCRRGRIADMFDLDLLIDDYAEFADKDGIQFTEIKTAINSLRNSNLEDFMGLSEEKEEGTKHFILTGLFLGYPIETTYSIISDNQ